MAQFQPISSSRASHGLFSSCGLLAGLLEHHAHNGSRFHFRVFGMTRPGNRTRAFRVREVSLTPKWDHLNQCLEVMGLESGCLISGSEVVKRIP